MASSSDGLKRSSTALIEIPDSIPYGQDTMDTAVMQQEEMEEIANRFAEELPEEPLDNAAACVPQILIQDYVCIS